MTHILIPREPSPALLRPFVSCPQEELPQAYAAMIRIAEVERARAGSQCLAQIEEPAGAASAAVSRRGEYPPLPEGVMFIEQIGGDVIARPTEYAYFKNARGVVHGAQLFTADQLRAYFDLGRQPEARALEAPAAPGRQPLTDERIEPLFRARQQMQVVGEKDEWFWFAWGVADAERAHGITAAAPQAPAAPAVDALAPVQALLDVHAELLDANPYAYFELAYTRQTGWMAWITDKPFHGPVINPDRKVLARGQGDTASEACAAAAQAKEGGTQ
ncbi:hypothetical protein I6G66_06170 [Delftia acidovorans]|uniref:Uncharacterized protein n=1 Tax=Delftia acidovorans TaxID=80866 RepID=A0A7T2S637_DELAC|nr:hypothetical protein [Delftia acidovorans]QPS09606.1 hypothetical protein I6G66_06170 [Delftia acidovorans]